MVILYLISIFLVGGLMGWGFGLNHCEYEDWKQGYEDGTKDECNRWKEMQDREVKTRKYRPVI